MPWKEIYVMDQKIQMISRWLTGEYSITELSQIHDVSRKTLYKWIERYQQDRENGLKELSRRPATFANATSADIVSEIVKLKEKNDHWGARKLHRWLEDHRPEKQWPVPSTMQDILKRHDMVKARKKRHHTPPYSDPFLEAIQPNEVWSADYKGQFRLGCGDYCYPFTLTDNFSRYLLDCHGLAHPAYKPTRDCFKKAFQEYGLPNAIRTDNGVPFASTGIRGLSKLSIWFIRLGILPERIEKGHPEQNGRHERMHRTLKEEATKPPRYSMAAQQRVFNRFQHYLNNDRPHGALGLKTPASVYKISTRKYPNKLPDIEYPEHYQIRRIHQGGSLKWGNKEMYFSSVLAGEYVGLTEVDNGLWTIYLSFFPVAILDERTFTFISL